MTPPIDSSRGLETPLVLLIFNRPECTARVLDVVRSARPGRLWVVADGPRLDRPGEAERVAEVRGLIESGIDWACEVRCVYSDVNLGCARRVSSGLDAVFGEEAEAIILEDDCVPDPTFFRFCTELLERFREDPRVAVVAGDNFQDGVLVGNGSYYFSRYPHCWGWATWRRAWRAYDHAMTAWPSFGRTPEFARAMSSVEEEDFWRHAFAETREGRIDTWDFRWVLTCWTRGWLTVLPQVNLVSNIGFASDATNTRTSDRVSALAAEAMRFPLRHPENFVADSAADAHTARRFYLRSGPVGRVFGRVRRLLSARLSRG